MRNKLLFTTLTLALASIAIPACGGSSDDSGGPDVSAADGTATDNGDGTFNLDLSITFDDDVDVDHFTLDCTNGADSADDFSIPNASDDGSISPQASGTLTVTLDGLTDTETGSYSCNLTLIDEDNDASATFEFDFDLT